MKKYLYITLFGIFLAALYFAGVHDGIKQGQHDEAVKIYLDAYSKVGP